MQNSAILDISAMAVIIISGLNGARRGIILSISGICALVAAFFGAGYLQRLFSPLLTEYVVAPWIRDWLAENENLTALTNAAAAAKKAFDVAVEAIKVLLADLGVPGFISGPLAKDLAEGAQGSDNILNTAVATISERLSDIMVFSVGFILILFLVLALAHLVNRFMDFTPVGVLNKLGGWIFGAALGAVLVFVVLSIVPKVAPALAAEGMLFSEQAVKDSFVVDKFTMLFKMASGRI